MVAAMVKSSLNQQHDTWFQGLGHLKTWKNEEKKTSKIIRSIDLVKSEKQLTELVQL